MVYIYEAHLGGLYWTREEQEFEHLCCEQCGDSDWLKGVVADKKQLYRLFEDEIDIDGSGGMSKEYFDKFAESIPWDEEGAE